MVALVATLVAETEEEETASIPADVDDTVELTLGLDESAAEDVTVVDVSGASVVDAANKLAASEIKGEVEDDVIEADVAVDTVDIDPVALGSNTSTSRAPEVGFAGDPVDSDIAEAEAVVTTAVDVVVEDAEAKETGVSDWVVDVKRASMAETLAETVSEAEAGAELERVAKVAAAVNVSALDDERVDVDAGSTLEALSAGPSPTFSLFEEATVGGAGLNTKVTFLAIAYGLSIARD